MTLIFLGLALLVTAFLIMISVQLLKIEKTVTTVTMFAEKKIKHLYGKK
ncbi:MAG: hypothetical protein ACLFQB_07340 [Chitinispirillaceae bacterium]